MIAAEALRSQIKGRVVEPRDSDYDDVRRLFAGGIDRRPAHIVRVADADDVARVIEAVRESSVELAVRSGGHSAAGHSVTEGGVVIDLRDMRRMEIDVEERMAWAQTGLTARDYSVATHKHGLATGFGDTGSVGIGGLTLGGGIGYLSRKHGLTIDNLIEADVVTADGRLLRANSETNPDLFWAVRGGGGNFGVATRFKFRLHEVGTVYGGMLMLPATADAIASLVEAAEAAEDELTIIANVIPAPPMPFVPAEHHGRLVILAFMVHAGTLSAGERCAATFRSLAPPIVDMLRPMPYPDIYPPEDPSYHPMAITRTMMVDSVDRRSAATMIEHLEASDAKVRAVQIRVLGGAIARVASDSTAYAHRTRRIMLNVAAIYDNTAEAARHQAWVDGLWTALQSGEPAAYVNFLANEGVSRIHEAYPARTWDRLVAIKGKYDPTNLFRLNQNIPPAHA